MDIQSQYSDSPFPDRADLKNKISTNKSYYDSIVEQTQQLDLDNIEFKDSNWKSRTDIIESQKTFFWIRVYLKEEIELKPDQDVTMEYTPTSEKLQTRFICYAKKGLDKDADDQVVNYNAEDNKKVLCLMVDSDRINTNSSDIPFVRSLFKIGRYYQPQVMRLTELTLTDASGKNIEYFDIDF